MEIDKQTVDLIRMNEEYVKDKKNRKKKSLQNVLVQVQKEKLFSTIINEFNRKSPRLQFNSKKLTLNYNSSTLNVKTTKTEKTHFNTIIDFQSNKEDRNKTLAIRKNTVNYSRESSIGKKMTHFLPSLPIFTTYKIQELNPKDKKIQDLFSKLAKSNEFIYSINFPKKYLIEFIAKSYTKKFAHYFNWFFQLRSNIDYKYYIDIGKKILDMDSFEILHFVYSAFQGFNHQFCFQMFKQNFGTKDLIHISRARETLRQDFSNINFQKMTYQQLKERNMTQNKSFETSAKLDTVYRNTFFYKQLSQNHSKKEKQKFSINFRPRANGELSFEQFCNIYNSKIPHFYLELVYKLFFIELKEDQLDEQMKQRHLKNLNELSQQQNKQIIKPVSKLLQQLKLLKERRQSLDSYY